jgi:hypothetical protein
MSAKTLLYFPAVQPDPPEVEVDASDFDDAPTEPLLPRPERPTDRPSSQSLAALVQATKDEPAWLQGPRYAYDPTLPGLVLAEPYLARVTDPHGTAYLVECPVGVPAGDGSLGALLSGSMPRVSHVRVLPHGQTVELLLVLDDQWRRDIVESATR